MPQEEVMYPQKYVEIIDRATGIVVRRIPAVVHGGGVQVPREYISIIAAVDRDTHRISMPQGEP
jgi:hypothetical protein